MELEYELCIPLILTEVTSLIANPKTALKTVDIAVLVEVTNVSLEPEYGRKDY